MELLDMVREYQGLLEAKESLAKQTKDNNAAIEAAKERIAQQMLDDDCPSITTGGYVFSLVEKTYYSKKSADDLAAAGVDFFDTLREEGLGDIIVERVDPRTLQSTMKAYVDKNGDLSDALQAVIRSYDGTDISHRKETKKKGRKKE